VRALHPKKVALLTLFNNADGGGTRLFFLNKNSKHNDNDNIEDNSTVICAQCGDLLIFDNASNMHGVDELNPIGNETQEV
jgi:hypothetical protein